MTEPESHEITLTDDKNPPDFVPKSTQAHLGDTILFTTASGDTRTIQITTATGDIDLDITIRTPWVPPAAPYDYGLKYVHKGGTTTGNVNVIVND